MQQAEHWRRRQHQAPGTRQAGRQLACLRPTHAAWQLQQIMVQSAGQLSYGRGREGEEYVQAVWRVGREWWC